jgi:hypothetical protein
MELILKKTGITTTGIKTEDIVTFNLIMTCAFINILRKKVLAGNLETKRFQRSATKLSAQAGWDAL